MSDWIGLGFFIFLIFAVILGLKILSKPRKSTEEEFEESASLSASPLSAGINALNGLLNPGDAKGKEAITEVKKGIYRKKQGQGKNIDEKPKKKRE